MKDRMTQSEAIFYALYQKFQNKTGEYIPVWEFMGEHYCLELKKWGYVSHECSARASEMKKKNPDLVQSIGIIGKSGARYFGYRLTPFLNENMIMDDKLKALFKVIAGDHKPKEILPPCPHGLPTYVQCPSCAVVK